MGSGGLSPEKIRATPSRTSENALLEQEIKVAIIIIDLFAQIKAHPLTWK